MSTYSGSFINTSTVKVKDSEGFPGGLEVKASACNSGDLGSIPGLGRYHGEGNGNPFQYSCLESPMDRGSCVGYTPQGSKELDTDAFTMPSPATALPVGTGLPSIVAPYPVALCLGGHPWVALKN